MKFHPRDATMWFFCWASTKGDPGRDYPTSSYFVPSPPPQYDDPR
jgi:hypothetical protein